MSMQRPENPDGWLLPGAKRDTQSVERDLRQAIPQKIDGVYLRTFTAIVTGYGRLAEVLRSEWLGQNKTVDQIFVSNLAPGNVTAWHAHQTATDRLFIVSGAARVVLYDARAKSPTKGIVQEFSLTGEESGLLVIPPKIWHGVKNVGADCAIVLNAVDEGYRYESPDHWRVPPDSNAIPYRF